MAASNSTIGLDEGQPAPVISAPQSGAIDEPAAEQQALAVPVRTVIASRTQRETGDQVNRFMLCALVSESAKRIKRNAVDVGESLPMPMIVRKVLRSYLQATADRRGALAGPEVDFAGLTRLNHKILRDEIARHSSDRVKNHERQLARARQLGDDARIKAEADDLEHAIEARDRLAKKFS